MPTPVSLTNALKQADVIAPNRHADPESDGIYADPRHIAGGTSDHIPDANGKPHAVDVDNDPWAGYDSDYWANQVRLRCQRGDEIAQVVEYIISYGKIASSINNWEWRIYRGSDPHQSHAHYSIKYTAFAENWTGQWWVTAEGAWGNMTDAEIIQLFKDQSTQRDAQFKEVMQGIEGIRKQNKNHQQALRALIAGDNAEAQKALDAE